eukprot:CAMPEP_0197847470 /NCGR_PEP_ID=MMETSP1438-20131217/6331_1 /TAXON_ID=1461541 /ORGANISM="Pterosperma sp., Strain CCMP1384" /LENGTH=114 /DNA_ID=CAMNT_0043459405 /DNA_START=471 /DNA_END=815 /DNA_ORIENTATION=-
MVGLGHEKVGVGEFYTEGFWKGDLFVDTANDVYKALGCTTAGLGALFAKETMEAGKLSVERGTKGNFEGDGFKLGGIWVFNKNGEVTYAYKAESFGDHPPPEKVLEEARKAAAA